MSLWPDSSPPSILPCMHKKYIQRPMSDTAKVFRSGGSQAVRLPKNYRVDGDEVLISRQGNRIILESPRRTWSQKFIGLAGSSTDFPYPPEPEAAEPGPDLD